MFFSVRNMVGEGDFVLEGYTRDTLTNKKRNGVMKQ